MSTRRPRRHARRSLDRKGLELSINFFVMLIIIITIFSGSVYFLQKFYTETQNIEQSISRDTEQQIEGLLRGGSVVAIPLNKKELKRGQSHTYWLGILNILGEDRDDFGVVVRFSKAFTPDEQELTQADPSFINDKWVLVSEGPYSIANNDFENVGILVNANSNMAQGVPTAKGTYVFNVCVHNGPFDPNICQVVPAQLPDSVYTGKVYKVYVEVV